MNPRLIAFLLIALLPETLLAETSFTAVGTRAPSEIFVAAKDQPRSFEMRSRLMRVHPESLRRESIRLPRELSKREIIALLPAQDRLYVLSQWTIEQGDSPRIHALDLKSRRWKNLGELPCSHLVAVEADARGLIGECEIENPDGSFRKKAERISLGKGPLPAPGRIPLPQTTSPLPGLDAKLEGDLHHWDRLEVSFRGKTKTLHAKKTGGGNPTAPAPAKKPR